MSTSVTRQTIDKIALIAPALVALFGLIFVAGLLSGNPLPSLVGPWPPMKPNTGLCFLLCGLAFLLQTGSRLAVDGPRKKTLHALSLISFLGCGLLALASFLQYPSGMDFGIDRLLLPAMTAESQNTLAIRMSPETALSFVILSVVSAALHRLRPGLALSMGAGFALLLQVALACASLLTYFSPVLGVFGWLGYTVMSGDSALLFLLLGSTAFLRLVTSISFPWELGRLASTGFALAAALLMIIGLTVTRTQYQLSARTEFLAKSEKLFAHTTHMFSVATQIQNHFLSHLTSQDLRALNEALSKYDHAVQVLDEFSVLRTEMPEHFWLYVPIDERTREFLAWSRHIHEARLNPLPPEQLKQMIRQGEDLLTRMEVGLHQLESEHVLITGQLRRENDYVARSAFLITALGSLASLALILGIMLRVNQMMIERRSILNQLAESEQEYRTLADTGQALIWTAGTDSLCTYFNKVWFEFTGRTLEQERGNGWAEGVHPEDLPHCLETYNRAFAARRRFSMDYRLRRHDGEYRWIQDDGVPRYDVHGSFLGYIGYCLDITERRRADDALRESELRFRRLLDDIPSVAVQGYNAELQTLYWNKASETLYGYSAGEALGQKLTDLIIPPEMVGEVHASVARMLATGHPTPSGELSLRRKDGSRVSVISSHAHVAIPGKPPEMFCVDIDIGERKQMEAELTRYRDHLETLVADRTRDLEQARDAAEAANRAKSSFLANMSHEIRTPMNAIIGFTHLLRRDSADEGVRTRLDKINDAAQHLLGIINNILDLSKIEAEHLVFEEKALSPATLIDETLTMLRDRARAKGLNLARAIDPDVPPQVLGDTLRLSQILLNLVGNAIKFTAHGDVTVCCGCTGQDTGHVELRFEIRDSGIGLDDSQKERIFEPFVQADGSTTRRYGGTGLGLTICRRLVEAMGGQIGVDSRIGAGSTFWFTVRLRPCGTPVPARSASATATRPMPLEDVIRLRFGGQRVLLVEDDPISREVALELLGLAGLVIDHARNGEEAVERARTGRHTLILMDMQMPVMNGLEATRAIRRIPGCQERPFILAMTANAFDTDRADCLEAGMNDHIQKPVNPDALFETLLRWLDREAAGSTRTG